MESITLGEKKSIFDLQDLKRYVDTLLDSGVHPCTPVSINTSLPFFDSDECVCIRINHNTGNKSERYIDFTLSEGETVKHFTEN